MILLVEDDDLVRELLRTFLESAGHTVMEAASAEEALNAVAVGPEDLQLLVTDMNLPRLDGAELARRLGAQWPRLKVLYMSGNPADHARALSAGAGVAALSKPFSRGTLVAAVHALLTSQTG